MGKTKTSIPKIGKHVKNGAPKQKPKEAASSKPTPTNPPGPWEWLADPAEDIYKRGDGVPIVWPTK